MDIISTVVPQSRVISGIKNLATGAYSFVGQASVEAEILDAQTGTMLAAAVDRREGGKTLEGVTNSWDDVEQAFQFWADRLSQRVRELHQGRS